MVAAASVPPNVMFSPTFERLFTFGGTEAAATNEFTLKEATATNEFTLKEAAATNEFTLKEAAATNEFTLKIDFCKRSIKIMKIYLIRHTPAQMPDGVCGGWSDWPLAPDWQEGAARILANLPNGIARIESSPLTRCYRLAQQLGAHFAAPIRTDERLREIHFGEWEGRAWEDIEVGALNRWMNDWVGVAPPGGENFLDLQARARSWWRDLPDDENIAVVSHAGPIRALLCDLLEVAPAKAFRLHVELGAICVLRRDPNDRDAAVLEKWNA